MTTEDLEKLRVGCEAENLKSVSATEFLFAMKRIAALEAAIEGAIQHLSVERGETESYAKYAVANKHALNLLFVALGRPLMYEKSKHAEWCGLNHGYGYCTCCKQAALNTESK